MKAKHQQTLAWIVVPLLSLLVILPALSLVLYIVIKGFPALSPAFLFGPTTEGGLSAPLVGTLPYLRYLR